MEMTDLDACDVVAVYVAFQADQRGGGPSIHQALVQHMMCPQQLPFPSHQEWLTCNLEWSNTKSRLSSPNAGLVCRVTSMH